MRFKLQPNTPATYPGRMIQDVRWRGITSEHGTTDRRTGEQSIDILDRKRVQRSERVN